MILLEFMGHGMLIFTALFMLCDSTGMSGSSFFDRGSEIPCRKGKRVSIFDHIPTAPPDIELYYRCDCPNGLVKCYYANSTTKGDSILKTKNSILEPGEVSGQNSKIVNTISSSNTTTPSSLKPQTNRPKPAKKEIKKIRKKALGGPNLMTGKIDITAVTPALIYLDIQPLNAHKLFIMT